MNYTEYTAKDINFYILKILSLDNDYKVNENIIQMSLAEFAHNLSSDSLRQHLTDLEGLGLLTTENLGNLIIAKLSRKGLDVVRGVSKSPLVRRPNPEEL